MGNIVMWMGISVDGYFEGPNREIDWHYMDDELHRHVNRELARMGAFLHGRVTYELMADFWPTADEDPDSSEPVVEFAGIWRDMPKVVYSTTLEHAGWNSTIVREVVAGEVEALKAATEGDLVVGGADLAATFRRLGLIDEYRIYIHPVVLGRGRPLFEPADGAIGLRLVDTRAFGNGVVLLHYERA
jgi:dihydrofolate reductase